MTRRAFLGAAAGLAASCLGAGVPRPARAAAIATQLTGRQESVAWLDGPAPYAIDPGNFTFARRLA